MAFEPDKSPTQEEAPAEELVEQVETAPAENAVSLEELKKGSERLQALEDQAGKKDAEELQKAREALGIKPEHDHEKADKEAQEKTLKDIAERAKEVGGKVGERADALLNSAERSGMNTMPTMGDMLEVLQNKDMREKYYPGWSATELDQLAEVLFNENHLGQSFEEAKKFRAEFKEQQRKEDERLAKIEEERKAEEEKERQDQIERKRIAQENLRKEQAEEEAKKAEEQRKNRWLGLGRFFK